MSTDEWDQCCEFEAILRLQQALTILSQNEKKLNASFGGIIKQKTHKKLTSTTIKLINVEQWDKYNQPPRVTKRVDEMADVGKECLKRLLLNAKDSFLRIKQRSCLIQLK